MQLISWVYKSMAIVVWWWKGVFIGITVGLKLNQLSIWQMLRVWRVSVTCILSGFSVEELNHTVTTHRGSTLILLGCHYILLDVTGGLWEPIGIIYGSVILIRVELKLFQSIERVRWWHNHNYVKLSLPDRIEPEGSHTLGVQPTDQQFDM